MFKSLCASQCVPFTSWVHLQNFDCLTLKALWPDRCSSLHVSNAYTRWEVRVLRWRSPTKLTTPRRVTWCSHSSRMKSQHKALSHSCSAQYQRRASMDWVDFPSPYRISEREPGSLHRTSAAMWLKNDLRCKLGETIYGVRKQSGS